MPCPLSVSPPAADAAAGRQTVVGSWLETVVFPEGPPFNRRTIKSLMIFHSDGTSTAFDSGAVNTGPDQPGVASANAGVWKQVGPSRFGCTQVDLLSDLSGNHVGYLFVRGTYDVAGNTYKEKGNTFAQVLDLACQEILPGGVTVDNKGHRISFEPKPR